MPFYTFNQNNSGGSFHFDREAGLTHHVIIEATTVELACIDAIQAGVYFDGCSTGQDCSCCGDRWSRPWNDAGFAKPGAYESGQLKSGASWMKPNPETCIHFADGTRRWYMADGTEAFELRQAQKHLS